MKDRDVNVMADPMAARDLTLARDHIQHLRADAEVERMRRARNASEPHITDVLLDTLARALIAAGERLKRQRMRRLPDVSNTGQTSTPCDDIPSNGAPVMTRRLTLVPGGRPGPDG